MGPRPQGNDFLLFSLGFAAVVSLVFITGDLLNGRTLKPATIAVFALSTSYCGVLARRQRIYNARHGATVIEELTIVAGSGSGSRRPRPRVLDKATRRRVLDYFVLQRPEEKEKGDCVRDVESQVMENGKAANTYGVGVGGDKGAKAASGGVGAGSGSGGGSTSGKHRGGSGGGGGSGSGGGVGSPLRSPPPYVSPPPSYASAVSRQSARGQIRRSGDAALAVAEGGAAASEVELSASGTQRVPPTTTAATTTASTTGAGAVVDASGVSVGAPVIGESRAITTTSGVVTRDTALEFSTRSR